MCSPPMTPPLMRPTKPLNDGSLTSQLLWHRHSTSSCASGSDAAEASSNFAAIALLMICLSPNWHGAGRREVTRGDGRGGPGGPGPGGRVGLGREVARGDRSRAGPTLAWSLLQYKSCCIRTRLLRSIWLMRALGSIDMPGIDGMPEIDGIPGIDGKSWSARRERRSAVEAKPTTVSPESAAAGATKRATK